MTFAVPNTLKKYPFIKLLLPLIAGIILQWYLQLAFSLIFFIPGLIIVALSVFIFLPVEKRFSLRWLHGIFIMLLIATFGCVITYIKDIRHQKEWVGNYYQPSNLILITLEEPLIEKTNSYKAEASVNAIESNNKWINTRGKILVYFQKDDAVKTFTYGTQLLINKPLQPITNSGNPGAFDYKRYCLFQDITHQVYLKVNEYAPLKDKNTNWLKQTLYSVQHATINRLQRFISGNKEQGVAEALLIGYRNDLDKDLVQAYSNTGVVHIIAISGLHIGMIYALMLFVLRPLKRYRWTKWFNAITILFVLWGFTLVAGAVPSILRSAVMFTFIVIGQAIDRKTNIYNTLAASAFCMLAYNPFMLWDVGFLLSYAAVISIVAFVQPIYNWLYFKNKILDKVWAAASVTLAAQILTIPVVIFYFHQFPRYFLITNLLVVPLSALILYGEIFLLCISFIGSVASVAGNALNALIWFMNSFIEYMNTLPFAVWNNLEISIPETWLLYGLIIMLCLWLLRKSSKALLASLAILMVFIVSISFKTIQHNQQQKLIVYNVPKQSAIDIIQGQDYYFIGDSVLLEDGFLKNFHLKPARILYHVVSASDSTVQYTPDNILHVENTSVLMLDNFFKNPSRQNKVSVDVIILCKNPKLQIAQLRMNFDFKELVFDSSNPLWKIEQWKKDCDSLHLRFHSVPQQGAFVMDM